ncbi:MAG TPA: hypothetical protein GX513_08735 [Firmicutes bacterium]|nr:hypothetical protein [Bacillota bacterium]
MEEKRVTSLEEIRAQLQPDVIEIPGFRPGTVINVAIRPVDLTPQLLEHGLGNPLLAALPEAVQPEEGLKTVKDRLDALMPLLDAVARAALAEPSYEELTAIHPLTLDQTLAIFAAAGMGATGLASFRGIGGVPEAGPGGGGVE